MHEHVKCPKCGGPFECQVGNITQCQCTTVRLTNEERTYISERFADCLCAACMLVMKSQYHAMKQRERMEQISTLFRKQ